MTTPRASRFGDLSAAALLSVLALAGCGSDSDSSADPATETSPAEALTAADGIDYTACDDGRCEVAVTEPRAFEFESEHGSMTYNVTEVTDGEISIEVIGPGGVARGAGLYGPCEAVISATSVESGCDPDSDTPSEPAPEPGVLVVQLLEVNEGEAILRFTLG
jgi:hypothetical protein